MEEHALTLMQWLGSLPDVLVYLLLGLAAALENIIPPIPADVMILLGGVLAGRGVVEPALVFLVVWIGNVGSALAMYALGRHFGASFFQGRLGNTLLPPLQAAALTRAYRRYGVPILFFSRFLPVFRPVVPVFAGVARVGLWRTALPIGLASAIWYGFVVYLGTIAGANWRNFMASISEVGGWLWIVTALLLLLLARGWWKMRRRLTQPGEEP